MVADTGTTAERRWSDPSGRPGDQVARESDHALYVVVDPRDAHEHRGDGNGEGGDWADATREITVSAAAGDPAYAYAEADA